jgi:hypothetical protein
MGEDYPSLARVGSILAAYPPNSAATCCQESDVGKAGMLSDEKVNGRRRQQVTRPTALQPAFGAPGYCDYGGALWDE